MNALELEVLPGTFAVLRFEPGTAVPDWTRVPGPLWASIETGDELTVICPETDVASARIAELPAERRACDWAALRVAGVLDFSLTGILAGISGTLAAASVSIFALSTFDTDYILVKRVDLGTALGALRAAGHRANEAGS